MAKESTDNVIRVSFNPETFSEGGGLSLDGVIATWKSCEILMWDYMGKVEGKSPSMKVELAFEDGEARDHYFGIASNDTDFIADETGTGILNISGADKGLNRKTGFGVLMESLINAGFDADLINKNDCKVFEGMQVRFQEQAVVINGKPAMKTSNGKEYPIMQAFVGEILVSPGESVRPAGAGKANKGKTAGKKAAAKKTPAKTDDAADDTSVEDAAEELVMALLSANDGELAKKDVATGVMKLIKDKGDDTYHKYADILKDVVNAAYQEEFLGDDARPWTFANGVVSMAG